MDSPMVRCLSKAGPPWTYVADIDDHEFEEAIAWLRAAGQVIVELDCARMLDVERLFDEFSAAGEFPNYFGKNWPAFDECLADLEWLPGSGYVFILRNPHQLLAEEMTDRPTFWRIIAKAAAEWAEPVSLGEWWDRGSIPFHVVMEMPQDVVPTDGEGRISVAGTEAALLPFEEPLTSENREFVARAGKWGAFDVSSEDGFHRLVGQRVSNLGFDTRK